MAEFLDNLRSKREREKKLERDLEGYQTDQDYAQSLMNARRNSIPSNLRDGGASQALQGGFHLGEIGGIPINMTDIFPADLGASALAALVKGGAMKFGALPVMAGMAKSVKGRSLAELIGKPRMAHEYTTLTPPPNQYTVPNKYIKNPDYNTGMDVRKELGLPTKEQYETILSKQRNKAAIKEQDWNDKLEAAISADARRASEIGNVQPTSQVQDQLSDDEWLKQWEAQGGASNRSVRQDSAVYGGQAMSVPQQGISELMAEAEKAMIQYELSKLPKKQSTMLRDYAIGAGALGGGVGAGYYGAEYAGGQR